MNQRKHLDIDRLELRARTSLRIASAWSSKRAMYFDAPEIAELCRELQHLFPEHFETGHPGSHGEPGRPASACQSCGAKDPLECTCTQEQRRVAWEKANAEVTP